MTTPKVAILMSTYNGEAYLAEQLESIYNQKNVDVELFVRDDGSTDKTLDIIKRWSNRIKMELISDGCNLGSTKSFLGLLEKAPMADYYAFSDQDDIWLPEKLTKAVERLNSINDTVKLYCSDLDLYYDGNIKGRMRSKDIKYNCYKALVENIATGCTMVFSRKLLEIVVTHDMNSVKIHDYWLYLTAMYMGVVIYDSNSYIYYRQHSAQQFGNMTNWAKRLSYWKKHFRIIYKDNARTNTVNAFYKAFNDIIPESKKIIIFNFLNYNDSLQNKISLLFDRRYSMTPIPNEIIFRIRILLGLL